MLESNMLLELIPELRGDKKEEERKKRLGDEIPCLKDHAPSPSPKLHECHDASYNFMKVS